MIGFPGLLAVVFIVLKLMHVVAWPWLVVLSPLWVGTVSVAFGFITTVIVGIITDNDRGAVMCGFLSGIGTFTALVAALVASVS